MADAPLPILDLFCGIGLGADGYRAAGFEPFGVDLFPQPLYPYDFTQADALDVLKHEWPFINHHYRAIVASPPCQAHTRAKHLRTAQGGESRFDDLLTPTLELLRSWRYSTMPWVVENVVGAPGMDGALRLCGSMFEPFKVQRHRLFLSNLELGEQPACHHDRFEIDPVTGKPRPWGIYHVPNDQVPQGGRTCRDAAHAAECMGIERDYVWTNKEHWYGLKEGYPPAYSGEVGRRLRAAL